jgi:hypothetical protein
MKRVCTVTDCKLTFDSKEAAQKHTDESGHNIFRIVLE